MIKTEKRTDIFEIWNTLTIADCCQKGGIKNQFNQIDILHLFQIVQKQSIFQRAKKEMK